MSLSIEERQLIELRIRNDAPSIVVAYVLWGFLGLLSAHRFYLGRPRSAILQILSWLTVIGGLVWWLFDAVMISAYIRDEKTALRARLVMEMGDEQRTVVPAIRPRIADAPADRAPVQPKAPSVVAASVPAGRPAEPDLVLMAPDEPPLTLGGASLARSGANGSSAAASETKPLDPKPTVRLPMDTTPAHKAQSPAVATLALSEAWPAAVAEPEPTTPAVQTVSIPHPEAVDSSPIEVFPPAPAPVSEAVQGQTAIAEDPLRLDRGE
jgi:TM2 domain-containing membrane protein YozV